MLVLTIFLLSGVSSLWASCKECHKDKDNFAHPGIEKCTHCHRILGKGTGHPVVVKNPASLRSEIVCGGCHRDKVERVRKSPMATAKEIIAVVRFAWKAQSTLQPLYTLETLPDYRESGQIVDDFLRKKCLRCHLFAEAEKRGAGCAACHEDGRKHKLLSKPSTENCLSCHRFNRTGQGYAGLFERDYSVVYYKFGSSRYHKLTPDVHYKKGMDCTHCHLNVMETPKTLRCTDCHRYRGIKGHDKTHKRLRCETCHAAWSFQDYGLHAKREDIPDWSLWKNYMNRYDPQMLDLAKKESDGMIDWLDGKFKEGVWFIGWTLKMWENPPLGIDDKGRICVLRPNYRFHAHYQDKELETTCIVSCYTPHTIRKEVRDCFSCHINSKAAGLGLRTGAGEKLLITNDDVLANCTGYKGRPLGEKERGALLRRPR